MLHTALDLSEKSSMFTQVTPQRLGVIYTKQDISVRENPKERAKHSQGMMVHVCTISTEETDAGGL